MASQAPTIIHCNVNQSSSTGPLPVYVYAPQPLLYSQSGILPSTYNQPPIQGVMFFESTTYIESASRPEPTPTYSPQRSRIQPKPTENKVVVKSRPTRGKNDCNCSCCYHVLCVIATGLAICIRACCEIFCT